MKKMILALILLSSARSFARMDTFQCGEKLKNNISHSGGISDQVKVFPDSYIYEITVTNDDRYVVEAYCIKTDLQCNVLAQARRSGYSCF